MAQGNGRTTIPYDGQIDQATWDSDDAILAKVSADFDKKPDSDLPPINFTPKNPTKK